MFRFILSFCFFLFYSSVVFPQVLINEFSSANLNGITDEDGDHVDWIELYNPSASVVNLEGYHLSDDALFLSKWTFPDTTMQPDSFLLIFASGKNRTSLHTSFKISSSGETLILTLPDSALVDSVSAIPLITNVSYGRKPDGQNSWFYFASPTPGKPNTTGSFNSLSGDTIRFSANGGYFPGGLELQLSSSIPSDSIFFTLDGSEPSMDDSLYTNPILLSKNTVVRARSLNSQKLPGTITTNTYITKQHTIPVVCLSTDPENLWDYNTGIYAMGPNAAATFPFFGANFWQEWERKAHMEFYDVEGVKQIDQDIGIKISGNYSRGRDQKSLALYARSDYGNGSFKYQFFKDKPIKNFESIVLRNGGNDWGYAILRDGLASSLVKDMDLDRQAYQPSILYLNGEYWGILEIREKVNENFLSENHPVNPDSINLLEWDGEIIEGSNTSYKQLTSYLKLNTLESEQKYLEVSNKVDINNLILFQLTEIYVNNRDWPGNNCKYWNTNSPGSLWRWILIDCDAGFSLYEDMAYITNTLKFAMDSASSDESNPPWSTLLFRRLLSNPGYKNNFITQYADRLNTNFSSAKVISTLDSLKQLFMPEINDHMDRWGLSYTNWISNIDIINNYATNRPDFARSHLQSEFGLSETLNIIVDIDVAGHGKVKLNSIIPDHYPFNGVYFKDLPIKLTALPSPGYKFSRWEGAVNSTSLSIDYDMSAMASIKAVFEEVGINIVINEINYNSSVLKDTKDWVELYNAGSTSINLKNWIISDGAADAGYTFPSDNIIAPGGYIVVCRNQAAFSIVNPAIKNITGDINFGLSSTGDDINLFDTEKNLVDFVNYTSNVPWPTDANTTGASIELMNPFSDNNNGSNWKSSPDGGTPGSLNYNSPLNTKYENYSPVISLNCYPNPFRDYTTIRINSPIPGKYKLEVYDLEGKLLNILADQVVESGAFYIEWDGRDKSNNMLPGGIYIIRLSGENQSLNLKVVMLK